MSGRPFPAHETALSHAVTEVPTTPPDRTAGEVRRALEGRRFDLVGAVYVVDPGGRLRGHVALTDLLAAPAATPVLDLVAPDPLSAGPDDDQERVAHLALERDVPAVPVVDAEGRLLGVVPPGALLAILRREHDEDILRLAGVRREDVAARRALEDPPTRRVRDRLPWLLVGLVGSAVATYIVARFERLLEARVEVAYFVPAIVYLADAIGTQTEAIAVRGLSRVHQPLGKLLWGELRTGLLIGLALGSLAFLGCWLGFGDVRLAGAVGIAIVLAGTVATTVGLLMPWMLSRSGRDPAFGSGPLGTIVQDVLSVLVYFVVATALVV
ncbi:MAG TPA: magnesium transporter [Planctomycetota bacterium]|nr:magnesium transporter [Planctomycetota bacterium]